MKKILVIFLSLVLITSIVLAACAKNDEESTTAADGSTTSAADLSGSDTEYGYETEDVTDEDGETVTDSDGKAETTQVAVVYKKNKSGKYYAQKLDENGEEVTNKSGEPVTVKSTYVDELNSGSAVIGDNSASQSENTAAVTGDVNVTENGTTAKSGETTTTTTKKGETTAATTTKKGDETTTKKSTTTTTEKPTATTKKAVELTKYANTTKFEGKESVPKTSATGEEVNFSTKDQEIIANMLEVPYLYLSSYENADGVPIDIAAYTAVWMAQHEGGTATSYNASPVCFNLFKYYGQTVVNFKTKVNSVDGAPLEYNKSKDTFINVTYPSKKQTVKITKIEDLGNNNFYKITGTVSNAGKITKVVAVMQKNKLDTSLGFSVKALKWSK